MRLIGRTEVPYVHYAGTYQWTGKPYFFLGVDTPPHAIFVAVLPPTAGVAGICESTFIPLKKTAERDTTQLPIPLLSIFLNTVTLEGGGSDPSTTTPAHPPSVDFAYNNMLGTNAEE